MSELYGGVETGGTWCVCALGLGPDQIVAEERFRTGEPGPTLSRIVEFFEGNPGAIRIGIGAMDDVAGYVPNGVLLNPADWAAIDLAVLVATQSINLNNNPWGLTFAASRAIPPGTAFVGDFRAGLTLFQRNTTSVYLTDSHQDMFVRNILVLLAETRALAAVTEPLAMVKVTAAAGAGEGIGSASAQSGRAAPRKQTPAGNNQ